MKGQNVKDKLVERVAQDLSQPEDWVDKVVSFQFKDCNRAMSHHNTVEVSGFGTFHVSQAKVRRRMEKFTEILTHMRAFPDPTPAMVRKMESIQERLAYYNQKLQSYGPEDQIQTHLPGVEE